MKGALPGGKGVAVLRPLAERIAAGTVTSPGQNVSGAIIHAALVHGFGLVMLYGGVGVWTLALLSVFTFGPGAHPRGAANYVV